MTSPIDWDYLAALSGGDREFELELLQTFVEDAQQRLEALAEAVNQGNVDQIKRDAHHLKGASGNVGISAMQSVAAQLEQSTTPETLAQAKTLVEELQRLFATVASEVSA
ncbi:Hpt domain-containing protein [Thermosynechococcus sp. HN-54]|uniref:Hpt domain-containing protein n=1 Tax=Thermosynechococcus sp. HN-54 TaxID=2933959 RepID=UPI00202CABCF|nr:Hpt domain-containing protein [Thermosynechococcus sp. HN-54]URR34517.1 Hpt domain-containing protein [Thermosynechococcus sp. HN-54]